MNGFRRVWCFLKDKYDLITLKKYTTLAGTLVFFLIMSIVPLSFWVTLIVGKLPIDTERIFSLPVFESVKDVLLYVREEAINATASVSILLLVTTLYSSTTLFYQMRHSGELIYNYRQKKRKGWRLRIGAFVLMFIVIGVVLAFAICFALGSFLFAKYLSSGWETFADYALLITLAFALVLLLNAYVCPYKTKIRFFIPGALVTVGAWVVVVFGFAVYLRFGNVSRLYGALSALIVFLLWLYVLMICFIVGVILNSERITSYRKRDKTP
jgi:membrane protein